MKTLKFLFLMVIPAIMLSCGNQSSNKNKDNTNEKQQQQKDNTNMGRDTMSKGSMLPSIRFNDQDNDEDFVKEAASGGLMEVELGRLAEQNARNPRVKKFGAMMVKDHSKANDELRSIATSKNINIPANMDDKHMDKVEDLRKKNGEEFDKDYMDMMVDDHEKDIDKFKKEAEDGKNPEVKAFASKTISTLMMHLDSAKAVREGVTRERAR
jgi:putative membrane protein